MVELFRVVHAKTGEPVTAEALEAIALKKPCTRGFPLTLDVLYRAMRRLTRG